MSTLNEYKDFVGFRGQLELVRNSLAEVEKKIGCCDRNDETDYLYEQREDLQKALSSAEAQVISHLSKELNGEVIEKILDGYAVYMESALKNHAWPWPSLNGFFNLIRGNIPVDQLESQALKDRAEKLLAPYLK